MRVLSRLALSVLSGSLIAAAPAAAQIDARMFRQPDVSATHIAFVYAGDIWVVPKTGRPGSASELAARRGAVSALLARRLDRSPFSANYDGNSRRLRRARAGRRSVRG